MIPAGRVHVVSHQGLDGLWVPDMATVRAPQGGRNRKGIFAHQTCPPTKNLAQKYQCELSI